jgi:hypothetical protein
MRLAPSARGSPSGFQPDAGAPADDDDGLAEQFRFAPGGYSSGCGGHDSSGAWCGRPVKKWPPGRRSHKQYSIRSGQAESGEICSVEVEEK